VIAGAVELAVQVLDVRASKLGRVHGADLRRVSVEQIGWASSFVSKVPYSSYLRYEGHNPVAPTDGGLFLEAGEEVTKSTPVAGAAGPAPLDAVDRSLVEALRSDARASWAELGRVVGMSGPGVQERARRLEERGVVTGYHAAVQPAAIGLGVTALVEVYQSDSADQDDVADRLAELPEIEDCFFVAGEASFVCKLRVADVEALERSIGRVRGLEGVARTSTTVVLSTRWEGRVAWPEASP
jgi:Lrp/AsnC family transcriptional regulator, leucine-responsive regulatory protein